MSKKQNTGKKQAIPQKSADTATVKSVGPKWNLWAMGLLIAIAAWFTYRTAPDNLFLDWDDQLYVTENPMVMQAGKTGTPPVWRTPIALNYHPLTMESMIMSAKRAVVKPGELSPAPFIKGNMVYHVLNSILVFIFAWLFTKGNLFISFFSGLLFAVHPMHVESVAWVSERKDVLYTFFFLLALIAYLRYNATKKTVWLLGALLVFILSCLSKAMAVSLVPVLFLIDWYQGRDLKSAGVWTEKILFFATAIFFGLVALDIQSGGNFHGMMAGIEGVKSATGTADNFTVFTRAQYAGYGMLQYLFKFFAPVNLSPFYAYPAESVTGGSLPGIYPVSLLGFLALGAASIWSLRKTKIIFFGFAFFFFTVALVSQFISVGLVVMADRYTYVPYIGLGLAVLLGIWELVKANKNFQYAAWSVMALVSLFFMQRATKQVEVWQNSETLWNTALHYYPNEGQILANLGNYYGKTNNLDKAAECFERAVQNNVRNAAVYEGLGNVYGFRNNPQKAAEMFTEAINIDPRKGNYYFNRGTAYTAFNPVQGIPDFTKAMELLPQAKQPEALARRAFCYMTIKDFQHALEDYNQLISIGIARDQELYNRGVAKLNLGDKAGAAQDFRESLRINPNYTQAQTALSTL